MTFLPCVAPTEQDNKILVITIIHIDFILSFNIVVTKEDLTFEIQSFNN